MKIHPSSHYQSVVCFDVTLKDEHRRKGLRTSVETLLIIHGIQSVRGTTVRSALHSNYYVP
jgi:hypothetical protein